MPDLEPKNPNLLQKTRELCRLFEIHPKRSKGQNFLINEKIYDEIISAAELQAGDFVLEVGPGLGFLTAKMASIAKKVMAVELDDTLAKYLQMAIDSQGVENVEIVNSDILKFNFAEKLTGKYKIVANLPYNISSIFLRLVFSLANRPERVVLMLQKEVAERICAAPPEMSILAISVQYYAVPQIIRIVKAGNFWPEPEIDSAIIRMDVKKEFPLAPENEKKFFRLVRIGFSARRKMLKNNLLGGLKIEAKIIEKALLDNNFDFKLRAEDLRLDDWLKLFASLEKFMI